MLKFIIIIVVVILGPWLEILERKNLYIFNCVSLLLAITFVSFDHVGVSSTPTVIEKNLSSVLVINPGGGGSEDKDSFTTPFSGEGKNRFTPPFSGEGKDSFIPPSSGRSNTDQPKKTDNSGPKSQNQNYEPKYRWGIDPNYSPSGAGSGSALSANEIPKQDEWINDPYIWNKVEENDSEEKKSEVPGKLKVDVDFPHVYDSNGDPTLLVPNQSQTRRRRPYTSIKFDHTAAHIHHAPELGILLPSNFDMAEYIKRDRAGRIAYAKEMLPRETIIAYQNALGKAMSPLFGQKKTISVPGFAGVNKINTELTIQLGNKPDSNLISIIREDGVHITTYSITDIGLKKLYKDGFWVLKDRNL